MLTIETLLHKIKNPNGKICRKILHENKELFSKSYGSVNNHQSWKGGYLDHIQEVMNIGMELYNSMSKIRSLPFSLSDVLLVLFLHDLEKPWKYYWNSGANFIQLCHKPQFETKAQSHEFRLKKIIEYGICLDENQFNALKYVEGELNDYSSRERIMNPLAALCHMVDVASARIWFDYPLENERVRTC